MGAVDRDVVAGIRVAASALSGLGKAEIDMDLPQPRSYKIKTTPEFVQLKEPLVEEIRTEALKVAEQA